MSSTNSNGKEVSIDEQCFSRPDAEPDRRLVPDSTQLTRAKVEANAPESDLTHRGLTLEEEERARAREREVERTRWARSADDREARTRERVDEYTHEPDWFETPDLDEVDWAIREEIQREAERIHEETDGVWTVEAIAKHFVGHLQGLHGRIANVQRDGKDWTAALFATLEDVEQSAAGTVPIEAIGKVGRESVDVEGEITQLWTPSHRKIQQVGLIADDTGKTKFTVWRKSRQPTVAEGDRVRFREARRNLFRGRWSIALTGESRIQFLDEDP